MNSTPDTISSAPKRARILNISSSSPKQIPLKLLCGPVFENGITNKSSVSPNTGEKAAGQASLDRRREITLAMHGSDFQCLPCLCRCSDEVKASSEVPDLCQGYDSIGNMIIRCSSNFSTKFPYFVRPHVSMPFQLLCDNHLNRLRVHQCCPGCGVFCLKGQFNKCRESNPPHFFHLICANNFGQCPHCLSTNYAPVEIDLTATPLYDRPSNTRMISNGLPEAVRCWVNSNKEAMVRRHTIRLPGNVKEIITADLGDPADRDAIRRAIDAINPNIRADVQTLESALVKGDLPLLFSVLVKNMNCNVVLSSGLTPLQFSANSGLFLICFILISFGANVDATDADAGRTALMMAAGNGHYGTCDLLIGYGKANVLCKDHSNDTALHLAAKAGAIDVVRLLIYNRKIKSLDEQDIGGWTPLMWAAENGHVETVDALLSSGARVDVVDNEGNIALHWAAMSGSAEVGSLLIERKGTDYVDKQNHLGYSPLMIACREDHAAFIELLLINGADPRIEDHDHKTAMTYLRAHVSDEDNPKILLMRLMEQVRAARPVNPKRRGLVKWDLSDGKERTFINVHNDLDDEEIGDFAYVTALSETSRDTKVDWHIDPAAYACYCTSDCASSTNCLCGLAVDKIWYDEAGRLNKDFPFGAPEQPQYLVECNRYCRCPASCRNRIVQRGVTARLKLMRTEEKGWGVFANEDLPKGTFIAEYAGELITDREAEERNEDMYLFELTEMVLSNTSNEPGTWLCIDAAKFGNVSRFINHGCESNLLPIKVFYDHFDIRAPHVAFFAAVDIHKGDELTFNYGPKFWGIKGKYFSCKCRSQKCLYDAKKINAFLSTYNASL